MDNDTTKRKKLDQERADEHGMTLEQIEELRRVAEEELRRESPPSLPPDASQVQPVRPRLPSPSGLPPEKK